MAMMAIAWCREKDQKVTVMLFSTMTIKIIITVSKIENEKVRDSSRPTISLLRKILCITNINIISNQTFKWSKVIISWEWLDESCSLYNFFSFFLVFIDHFSSIVFINRFDVILWPTSRGWNYRKMVLLCRLTSLGHDFNWPRKRSKRGISRCGQVNYLVTFIFYDTYSLLQWWLKSRSWGNRHVLDT